MNIFYHGHACFSIEGSRGKIIIDPFLTGNPTANVGPADVTVDAVLVTHGHGDHLGDTIEIAKRNEALVIAPFELAAYCEKKGARVHPMHIGGSREFPFGRVKLTQALHGSAVEEGDNMIYAGNPCGFVIEMDGHVIYHAGDTGLFGDMELLGKMYKIDVAMLPIGDNYVMGIDDAVFAAKLLKAKTVVPMHFNTFEVIEQNPEEFAVKVAQYSKPVVLKPGQRIGL